MKLSSDFVIRVNRMLIAQAAKLGHEDIPTLIVRRGRGRGIAAA